MGRAALQRTEDAGMLSFAAAGNDGTDNDAMPSSCNLELRTLSLSQHRIVVGTSLAPRATARIQYMCQRQAVAAATRLWL